MVQTNQGSDAGEVEAVGVECDAGRPGCHSHGLCGIIQVEDGEGFAGCAGGMDALAGIREDHRRCSQLRNHRGWCGWWRDHNCLHSGMH